MDEHDDLAADERRDTRLLQHEMEVWRTRVRPEDLRPARRNLEPCESYWVWRK